MDEDYNITNLEKVIIEKSSYSINMINFPDSNYFHTLNLKMGWGKRGEG